MLQGSLENFALDEVLGLLSSTAKTGRLHLEGDRGKGSLDLSEGELVDAAATNTANGTGPEDVIFELMRYEEGSFTFTVEEIESDSAGQAVADVLAAAESRLADWRTIEAVVPSLDHRVAPIATLPEDEVRITRDEWAVLVAIASGCSVSSLCDSLDLGEVEGSRRIKGLVERGLVAISSSETAAEAATGRSAVEALSGTPARDLTAQRPGPQAAPPTLQLAPDEKSDQRPLTGAAAAGPAKARPPMPVAPTADDLKRLVEPSASPPASGDGDGGNGNGNGDGSDPASEGDPEDSSTGLLMRYLRSED